MEYLAFTQMARLSSVSRELEGNDGMPTARDLDSFVTPIFGAGRTILYARLSREDKTEDDLKVARQPELCRAYVAEQLAWQIVAEIRRENVSDPTTGQIRSASTDDIACCSSTPTTTAGASSCGMRTSRGRTSRTISSSGRCARRSMRRHGTACTGP